MSQLELELATIISLPFEENTYIAWISGKQDCLIFDAGLEPDKILSEIDRLQLHPAALLCTHGHSDHIAGNGLLKRKWPNCPLVIGAGDADKLTDPELNLSAGFGIHITSPPANVMLREGEPFGAAGIELEVVDTPGHSAGHVAFICRQFAPIRVFGGDVLFEGSVGRTDFPDGSFSELEASIHTKLFTLPDDTIVLPGHGRPTTIGHEKRTNPFVGAPAGYAG